MDKFVVPVLMTLISVLCFSCGTNAQSYPTPQLDFICPAPSWLENTFITYVEPVDPSTFYDIDSDKLMTYAKDRVSSVGSSIGSCAVAILVIALFTAW
jgi:hypothetical protein